MGGDTSCEITGDGADKLVLDRLSGREKLSDGRDKCAEFDASELIDGERGVDRTIGDMGMETPLLDDIFRDLEKVEPAVELV